MDDNEGRALLEAAVQAFRQLTYAELVGKMGDVHVEYPRGPSGEDYTIEIEAMWDDRPDGDIRVIGSIDNGRGWRAFSPLTNDFVMTPAGDIFGEDAK